MYQGLEYRPPIFEIGLKGYVYGAEAVALAVAADRLAAEFDVTVIVDPQIVDIPSIASATRNLLVFAQHMDSVPIGRGAGRVLPEAIKQAGAVGTMLNHSESRITLHEMAKTIRRADEVGLATLVCADSPEEAAAVALLRPNMILAEPPDLVGTSTAVGSEMRDFVSQVLGLVRPIDQRIIVFCSAGIRSPEDVSDVLRLGVDATGSTSGILKSSDPVGTMRSMIRAMRETWDDMHR